MGEQVEQGRVADTQSTMTPSEPDAAGDGIGPSGAGGDRPAAGADGAGALAGGTGVGTGGIEVALETTPAVPGENTSRVGFTAAGTPPVARFSAGPNAGERFSNTATS